MHLLVFDRREFRALMELGIAGFTEQLLRTVSERLRAVDARLGTPRGSAIPVPGEGRCPDDTCSGVGAT